MTPQEISATLTWAKVRQAGMHKDQSPAIVVLASEFDRMVEAMTTLIDMGQRTSALAIKALEGVADDDDYGDYEDDYGDYEGD